MAMEDFKGNLVETKASSGAKFNSLTCFPKVKAKKSLTYFVVDNMENNLFCKDLLSPKLAPLSAKPFQGFKLKCNLKELSLSPQQLLPSL